MTEGTHLPERVDQLLYNMATLQAQEQAELEGLSPEETEIKKKELY